MAALATGVPSVAGPQESPTTLLDYAKGVNLNEELLAAVLSAMDLTDSDPLEIFANIPDTVVQATIPSIKKSDDQALTPGEQGRVVTMFKRIRAGFEHKDVKIDAAPKEQGPPPEPKAEKRKKAEVLDQLDDGTYEPIDKDTRKKMRREHLEVTGGKPMQAARPTSEQLAALRARIAEGRAPYVDFAVFGPFGARLAKMRKYEAQIFVDGRLETRIVKGPSDYDHWAACWRVFRSAMIMLGEASPQVLDDYAEGIRQLATLFPRDWGVIAVADEVLRSEQWGITQEELEDDGKDDNKTPWNKVIAMTTFGKAVGDARHWWDTHVVFPLQSKGNGNPKLTVQEIEGAGVPEAMGPSASGSNGANPGYNRRGNGGTRKPRSKASARPSEKCDAWNNGGCVKFGQCPNGNRHSCTYCGGGHRAIACTKGAGKGKSSGGGKAHGKGKKGKSQK